MTVNSAPPEEGLAFRLERLPIVRSVLWGPIDGGPPHPLSQSYPIFLHQKPLRQLLAHTRSAPTRTLLGLLLGDVYECPDTGIRYVAIEQSLRVEPEAHGDRTSALLTQLWLWLEAELRSQSCRVIGWYHNHPAGGLALSPDDIGTQLKYFAEPWQTGLVLGSVGSKPAGGWFRVAHGEGWAADKLPFYEVLAPDSIDRATDRRSFIDWANYRSYKTVLPPGLLVTPAVEAPREGAAPPVPPASEEPRAPAPLTRAEIRPAPRSRGVRVAVRVLRRLNPGLVSELGLAEDADEGEGAEPGDVIGSAKPPAPQPLWAAGAAGAAALGVLVVAGWLLGLIPFGTPAASARGLASAASPALPAPAVNPALVTLDELTDSVLGAVRSYRERGAQFDRGQAGCAMLAAELVAVDAHWIRYSVEGKPRDLTLDAVRAARDRSLYAEVDSVESHFDRSACPRP